MKKVITYGTYDLFHQGHYNLLSRAKALGDYLIVGVTSDTFDLERGKMNTCNNVMERIDAVRATGLADKIVIEEYKGQKIDDIQKYNVDIFAIGSDWEGYFDYLSDYCQVVYLPRTEGISSTQLRNERPMVRMGIIGTGSIANRFVPEAEFVNSVSVVAAYNPDKREADEFCLRHGLPHSVATPAELYALVDAVYIASPHYTHYEYAREALLAGKHVLCETPFVFREAEACELYRLAEERGLTLTVALKTAYCPAFGHLLSLLKSGVIGEIVEVTASTKERLEQLEKEREELTINIAQAQLARPKYTKEQIVDWISQFKYGNINDPAYQKQIIETFVNSVYLYEDRLILNYNYKNGTETFSLDEVNEAFGSDLKNFAPP